MRRSSDQQSFEVQQKTAARCPPRNVRFNQQQPSLRKKVKSNSILKKKSKYSSQPRSRPRTKPKQVKEGSFRIDHKILNEQSCENTISNSQSIKQYMRIMASTSSKRKFEDGNFPPVASSLFPFSSRDEGFYKNLKWMRVTEVFKGRNLMLWNYSKPTQNLTAGSDLCPSYIIQALNCLRTSTKFLSVIFEDQGINQNGVYYLKLFTNSVWRVFIIDDYIPVLQIFSDSTATYQPIFTDFHTKKASGGTFSNKSIKFHRTEQINASIGKKIIRSSEPVEIWMFLIQKALAKIYSCYEMLSNGNFFDLLTQLTGYDMEEKNFKTLSEEEKMDMKQFFSTKEKEIIVIGQRKNDKRSHHEEKNPKDPLSIELALTSKFSSKDPLILMREYSSNTSESGRQRHLSLNRRNSAASMNPVLKKFAVITPLRGEGQKLYFYSTSESDRLLHKNAIWPEDVKVFFSKIFVWGNHPYDYWGFSKINHTKDKIMVRKFSLRDKSQSSVSVYQKDRRFFGRKAEYEYCWMRVILIQKEFNGSYRWIGGEYKKRKSLTIRELLEAGDYYVLIIPEWKNRPHDMNFVLRTMNATKIQRVVYEKGMLEEGCADLAQRFGRMNQLNKNICSYNCIHEEMGFIIQNINNEKTMGVTKVRRMINNLKSQHEIQAFNEEFDEKKVLQVSIEAESYFTVVLLMKGGIDKKFFEQFNFSG